MSGFDPDVHVGPHEFRRLSWWQRNECSRCYRPREFHPTLGWHEARPYQPQASLWQRFWKYMHGPVGGRL